MSRLVKLRWIEVCREPIIFYIDTLMNTKTTGSLGGFVFNLFSDWKDDLFFTYYKVLKEEAFGTAKRQTGEAEYSVDLLKQSIYIKLNELQNSNQSKITDLRKLNFTELKSLKKNLLDLKYIEDKYVYIADLTFVCDEDIAIKNSVSYKNIDDGFGSGMLSKIIDLGQSITGRQSILSRMNNMQRYDSNDPLSITLSFKLYSRYNAILDVLIPTLSLQSASGVRWNNLYQNPSNSVLEVPGLFLAGLGELSSSIINPTRMDGNKVKSIGLTSRTIYIEIENLIFVADVILKNVDITYSSIMTKTGAPLYSDISLTAETMYPATSVHFFNYITNQSAMGYLKQRRLSYIDFKKPEEANSRPNSGQ